MSHVVMKKSLAKALMDAGVENFAGGGLSGFFGVGAEGPKLTSQDFTHQVNEQYGQQQDVYGQQQSLANQLLQQSQGKGPNPALAQLNQATGANVANQAALMAGQRGASANPALMARRAAQQGQMAQQQSVGQAASLSAQQQLAAQNALAQQQAQMANQALQSQSIYQGAIAAQNAGNLQAQGITSQANQGLLGGVIGGAGAALGLAKGGQVQKLSVGGPINLMGIEQYQMPQSMGGASYNMAEAGAGLAKGIKSMFGEKPEAQPNFNQTAMDYNALPSASDMNTFNAMQALPAAPLAHGGGIPFSTALLNGGKVPGKAEVKGDSEKNDTQPALLSPGEIVLPRSVTMAPDMEKRTLEFLKQLKKKNDFGEVVKARKMNRGGKA